MIRDRRRVMPGMAAPEVRGLGEGEAMFGKKGKFPTAPA